MDLHPQLLLRSVHVHFRRSIADLESDTRGIRPVAIIQFKTKVRSLVEADRTESPCIDLKRSVTRKDCDLKPHQHAYYNSDLFPSMLNHAYRQITHGREWLRLSQLPPGVTVDASGFLAVVTIQLPETFR